VVRVAICPGCNREHATDDADDPRADWCFACGGWGDPNPLAVENTQWLICGLAERTAPAEEHLLGSAA